MLKRLGIFPAFVMATFLFAGCGSGSSNTAIVQSVAAAPTFSVPAGSYAAVQTVSLSSSTPGSQIYYTVDGSTPTSNSTRYTGPVVVINSETIQAIAVAGSYGDSPVASAAYAISPSAAVPNFAVPAGRYSSVQSASLSTTVPGANIYYTTDGTTPTTNSTLYTGPITVSTTETIEAIVVAPNYTSPVISVTYVIQLPPASTPVFSIAAGTYTSAQSVTLSSTTSGAQIYYTTNGTAPTAGSSLYSAPLIVSTSETVQAIAIAANYSSSPVGSASYVIHPPASAPVFSTGAGTYTSAQNVALSSGTPGAQIYYTTDGSNPNTSSTLYAGPITVSSSETIKAVAQASNFSSSAVSSAAYVISSPVGGVTFSVPSGTYTSSQMVDLNVPVNGTPIYYTTDGSTPTTGSNQYRQTIRVSSSETIRAFTSTPVGDSGVSTATYVINLVAPAAPVVSVQSGTYSSVQAVVLASASTGVPIYYTTDGTAPTTFSSLYQEPVIVSTSETVRAAAITPDISSPVVSADYVISSPGSLRLNQNSLLFFRPGEVYTATLSNPTSGPITVNSIQITPTNWTQVNNCGTSLGANSSCIIAVTAGQSYGQFVGTLAVQASDSGDAHAIPLVSDIRNLYETNLGNGLVGANNFANASISGGVYEETLVPYQIYFFSGVDIEGQYPAGISVQSCTVRTMLSCSLSIRFGPPVGPGSAYITTNVPGKEFYVTDFGLTSTPSFVFSPAAAKAGSTTIGQTISFGVPLENSSTQTLLFTAPTLSTGPLNNGDFALVTNSVAGCQYLAGASTSSSYSPSCAVGLTFTPTALGTRATVLTLTESHGYSQQILVTGQGVTRSLTVTPSLAFGTQPIGTTSAPQTITVTAANQDAVSAAITSQVGGGFALTGPTTCAQGASSCQFAVTFTPPYVSPPNGPQYSGTVILTDTTTGYSTTTSLSGSGQ